MDIAHDHFVYDHLRLNAILTKHHELGAHTDIIFFKPGQVTTFMWTHPSIRPMGIALSDQCIKCSHLRTCHAKIMPDYSKVILKCSVCRNTMSYKVPTGWNWAHDSLSEVDDCGRWLFRVEKYST